MAFLFSSKLTTPAAPIKSFVLFISSLIFSGSVEFALLIASIISKYASYPKADTPAGSLSGNSFLNACKNFSVSFVAGLAASKKVEKIAPSTSFPPISTNS